MANTVNIAQNEDIQRFSDPNMNLLSIPDSYLLPLREHFTNDLYTEKVYSSKKINPFFISKSNSRGWIVIKKIINLLKNYLYKKDTFAKDSSNVSLQHWQSKKNEELQSSNDVSISSRQMRRLLFLILSLDTPSDLFIKMQEMELLIHLIPDLSAVQGIEQNQYHAYNLFYHSVYACDNISKEKPLLRLAALYHDLGKRRTKKINQNGEATFYNHEIVGAKMAYRFCQSIQLNRGEIYFVYRLVRKHMFHYTEQWTDHAVRRFYRQVGPDLINDLFALRLADRQANGKRSGIPKIIFEFRDHIIRIIQKDQELKPVDLSIDGHVLMSELNIKPGPIIGEIIKHLIQGVKDKKINNNTQALLNEAKQYLFTK